MSIYFNCALYDSYGVQGKGWLKLNPSISGAWVGIGITADPITLDTGISGDFIHSVPLSGDPISLKSKLSISGEIIIGSTTKARIKWSGIGSFDFTQGRDNVAGDLYLQWFGTVWKILKLGKDVIVYGSGGVTKLTPAGNAYGQKTLSKVGLKSEWSVDGSDDVHFFIDLQGRLCKMLDRVHILGYEEFLAQMSSPVVLYDQLNDLVYITDGTYGYVYSPYDESLGTCPANLTAVTHYEGNKYVAASGTLTIPTFEIASDILDFTTRNDKTIQEIEIGTNLSGTVEASIDFSMGMTTAFVSMGWHRVSPYGALTIPCYGREFKVKLRSSAALELDYLRIKGRIHDYNPIDT